MSFGMKKVLGVTYEQALAVVTKALAEEGFGVLTEIDVRETLKKKLNIGFRKYKILGACNPPFAHQALAARLDVGLGMPCNVIVYEGDDGKAVVSAVDPAQTIASLGDPRLNELAGVIRNKLQKVLDKLS